MCDPTFCETLGAGGLTRGLTKSWVLVSAVQQTFFNLKNFSMSNNTGFGKPKPQPKVSKRSVDRATAGKQFEKMKADGTPEYEIYVRVRDKKPWFPVGAIAVKASNQINRAIFDSQAQLLEGAFRIFPVLRKNKDQLEYGYRLKEFKDEPIQLAEMPKASLGRINWAKSAIALNDKIFGRFNRK
jgi:Family of unknown function (DUF6523)